MAVVTKGNEDQHDDPTPDDVNAAAEAEDQAEEAEEEAEEQAQPQLKEQRKQRPIPDYESRTGVGGGFFHIYKSGQGYWTRMGTVAGCGLLVALIAQFIYRNLMAYEISPLAAGITVGSFVIVSAVLLWWLLNKPTIVDFFIATESEMKKVNWTSRKDLIGSTKVVIFFMFLISAILFAIDIIFGYVFHWITVLKQPPF